MDIVVDNVQKTVPVTVVRLEGALDGSNYQQLIDRVKELYTSGTRQVLLDLKKLSFMSSAGLVAFHSIVMILKGASPPDTEQGWGAMRTVKNDVRSGKAANCKLLAPQPAIERSLEMTGFKMFLDVFTDEQEALASF